MNRLRTRILVIEDNEPNLDLMRYLLQTFGYEVLVARDGETGLTRAQTEAPCVILCDVQLPGLDGIELARLLKADPAMAGVPLIAVSALAMVGDRDRIMAAGFDGYISKPIEPRQFVDRVESYLRSDLRSQQRPTAAAAGADAPSHQAPPQREGTILVVDDMAANLHLLCAMLEPSGYQVLTAASGADALALMRDALPDMILADLHLGDEPLFSFLEQVKADSRLREIPFVIISSTSRKQELATTGMAKGAMRFLFRPIDPGALLAEIRNCLEEAP